MAKIQNNISDPRFANDGNRAGRCRPQSAPCLEFSHVAHTGIHLVDRAADALKGGGRNAKVMADDFGHGRDPQMSFQRRKNHFFRQAGDIGLWGACAFLHLQREAVALDRVDGQALPQLTRQSPCLGAGGQHKGVGLNASFGGFNRGGMFLTKGKGLHGCIKNTLKPAFLRRRHQSQAKQAGVTGAFTRRPYPADKSGVTGQCRLHCKTLLPVQQTLLNAGVGLQGQLAALPLERGRIRAKHQLAVAREVEIQRIAGHPCFQRGAAQLCHGQQPVSASLRLPAGAGGEKLQAPCPLRHVGGRAPAQRGVFVQQHGRQGAQGRGAGQGFNVAVAQLPAIGKAGAFARRSLRIHQHHFMPLVAKQIGCGAADHAGADDTDFHARGRGCWPAFSTARQAVATSTSPMPTDLKTTISLLLARQGWSPR